MNKIKIILKVVVMILVLLFLFASGVSNTISADFYDLKEGTVYLEPHQYAMWTLDNIEGGEINFWYDCEGSAWEHYIFVILFNSRVQYQKYLTTGEIDSYLATGGWSGHGGLNTKLPTTSPKTYYLVFDNTLVFVTLEEAINDIETEHDGTEFPNEAVGVRFNFGNTDQTIRYGITFDLKGDSSYVSGPTYHLHEKSLSIQQQKATDENNQIIEPPKNTPGFLLILVVSAIGFILFWKRKRIIIQ